MKKPTRPAWPALERTLLSAELPPDPRISPLALAILEHSSAFGEKRGYDPYDANDDARVAHLWTGTRIRR